MGVNRLGNTALLVPASITFTTPRSVRPDTFKL